MQILTQLFSFHMILNRKSAVMGSSVCPLKKIGAASVTATANPAKLSKETSITPEGWVSFLFSAFTKMNFVT